MPTPNTNLTDTFADLTPLPAAHVNAVSQWIERLGYGVTQVAHTDAATVTLTASQAQSPSLWVTGTLTAQRNLAVPVASGGKWWVYNATAGNQSLVVKTPAGTGVTIRNGYGSWVWSDGTHVRAMSLPINAGGTLSTHLLDGLPYTDVAAYGAVGDGVTDDTSAIQAAITAAPSGGIVLFPEPAVYYRITNQLTVTKPLTLQGQRAEIRQVTSTKRGLYITSSHVTVKGLRFVGVQYGLITYDEYGIEANGPAASGMLSNVRIENCELDNWGFYGIRLRYVEDFRVEGCRLTRLRYIGIGGLSVKNGIIQGNIIQDIPGEVNAYGITLTREYGSFEIDPRSENVLVKGNLVQDIPLWKGLDTHGGRKITFEGNTILRCGSAIGVTSSKADSAIYTVAPLDCSVIGNLCDSGSTSGSIRPGIEFTGAYDLGAAQAYGTGVILGNTVIRYGDQSNSLSAGIRIHTTRGLLCANNYLIEPSPYGINPENDNIGISVTDNVIVGPWSNTHSDAGGVNFRANRNSGYVANNASVSGDKVATYVLQEGIRIGNTGDNSIQLGDNSTQAPTPLKDDGNVSYANHAARIHRFLNKSTEIARFSASSNLLIGTSGDVARLTIRSGDATSATAGLDVTNSAGSGILHARSDGFVGVGGITPINWDAGFAYGTGTAGLELSRGSGEAALSAYVADGTNHRRLKLFVDNPNSIWGLLGAVSSGGGLPFVLTLPDASSVLRERLRVLANGNFGFGTTNPQDVLDLGPGTNARSIVWGGPAGAQQYSSLGTMYSHGGLTLLHGLKLDTTASQPLYSFATMARAGIQIGSFSEGHIDFFSEAYATKTVGDPFSTGANLKLRIRRDGRIDIPTSGSTGGLLIGDVQLFNPAPNVLRLAIGNAFHTGNRAALAESYFGYHNSYRVLLLGSTSTFYNTEGTTISLGADSVAVTGGTFYGDGRELICRTNTTFITPNAAGTDWARPITFANHKVGIGLPPNQAPVCQLQIPVAPEETPNYAVLSIGDGAWNGTTIGYFTGSALGTLCGGNAAAGFAGNLLDLQTGGVIGIRVGAAGQLSLGGQLVIGSDKTIQNLSASASLLTSGAVAIARGGTSLSAVPANGQLLIGNGTGYNLTVLTAGSGIAITQQAGGITIQTSESRTVQTVTGATVLTVAHSIVLVDTTSGNVTLTLPTAASATQRTYRIKKLVAANTVTLAASGVETIDGAGTQDLTVQYSLLTVVSDGTSWWKL